MSSPKREQLYARHARRERSARIVQPTSGIDKQFRDDNLNMLEIFPSSDSSEPILPSPEEARNLLNSLIPLPDICPIENFNKAPLFSVTLIPNTAELYGSSEAGESIY